MSAPVVEIKLNSGMRARNSLETHRLIRLFLAYFIGIFSVLLLQTLVYDNYKILLLFNTTSLGLGIIVFLLFLVFWYQIVWYFASHKNNFPKP